MGLFLKSFRYVSKSKFIRSIILKAGSLFLVTIITVASMMFLSFNKEITNSIIEGRQQQLNLVQNAFSQRMEEVLSISYNINKDKAFYIGSVEGGTTYGYEMADTLTRYLVGNGFIEYLVYYRLSEPNKVYASCGEMDFHSFWQTYLDFDDMTEQDYHQLITKTTGTRMTSLHHCKDGRAYFTYVCALPQFSKNPQAFLLTIIPQSVVYPILISQIRNCHGEAAIIDSNGNELYKLSTLDNGEIIDPSFYDFNGTVAQRMVTIGDDDFVIQKNVSEVNGWTYASAIRLNDLVSTEAAREVAYIVILLVVMILAVVIMFVFIIVQYKPINRLAMAVTNENDRTNVIDEKSLLSNTFATLKDDSEQKQKFENAYHEAEAASKAKSTFLSNMSHDIRTPMNAIIGMTEIAIGHTNDATYVSECLQKVRIASRYLLDIINNVLDMSRIESGRVTLSEKAFDLPELTYSIISIIRQTIKEKNLHFSVSIKNIAHERVIGDSVRITQVFMNILSNAIKFTQPDGIISLLIQEEELNGVPQYVFSFSDNGSGMSKEFIAHVFDTFAREKKAEISKIEGTGLGMAIARNLVELMNGTINCESTVGKGTTFTVTLPLTPIDRKVILPKTIPMPASVLILSNNDLLCANQQTVCAELGLDVTCVHSIAEACQTAHDVTTQHCPFNAVIVNVGSDSTIPLKAVTEIRNVITGDTSIVLATDDVIDFDFATMKTIGADAYMQTPLFRSSFLRIINKDFDSGDVVLSENIIDLTGRTILIAEDNPINQEVISTILEATHATVEIADDGEKAIAAYNSHDAGYYSIIFMDLQMPIMDGYQATAAIRTAQRTDSSTIPIYAMTANTFDDDVRQVHDAGMNGHIGKPYMPVDVFRILEEEFLKEKSSE